MGAESPSLTPMVISQGLTWKVWVKMSISQFPPGRDLTTYFPSCCLGTQLPISLHVGAKPDSPLWDNDWFGYAPNYCNHQEWRRWFEQSQRLEKPPEAWAKMIDKVHLLHKTTLSRLRKVDIWFNMQKPTLTMKETEEKKTCLPNKRTR